MSLANQQNDSIPPAQPNSVASTQEQGMSKPQLDLAETSLTVRDTFALAAMPIAFGAIPPRARTTDELKWAAEESYAIADAMLLARETP